MYFSWNFIVAPVDDQGNSESIVAGSPEHSEPMEMDEDNIVPSENEEENESVTSDKNEVLNQKILWFWDSKNWNFQKKT